MAGQQVEGDAEKDGFIIIKNAIPENIIAATKVDKSLKIDSHSDQYEFFEGPVDETISDYFQAVSRHLKSQSLLPY
jgi:hypothetical protein